MLRASLFLLAVLAGGTRAVAASADSDYFPAVAKLVEDRCLDCHTADDPEGKFVMETYADLLKGGESGPAIVPGKSAESLLVKYLRGEVEKDGKRKFMPPGKRDRLNEDEIAVFTKWIDAGARPPQRDMAPQSVQVPAVAPKIQPVLAVTALSVSPDQRVLAVGRHGAVELVDTASRATMKRLEGAGAAVNAIAWSPDGARVYGASGENGVRGSVYAWDASTGKLERAFHGHRDTIYALALSPDGSTLATGSYDQKIRLWRAADGKELRVLAGHTGAVFGVAFRPDGRVLASASADRTVKLWDAASGERRDTLSQALKEQMHIAWSPDGKRLVAAGADNRIRVWEVSPDARETTNPLRISRYAHEQPILRLAWSRDGGALISSAQDGTVKVWEPSAMKERAALPRQADWPIALAHTGSAIVAGLANGELLFFHPETGEPLPPKKTGARALGGSVLLAACRDEQAAGGRFHSLAMARFVCPEDEGAYETIECQAPAKAAEKPPELTRLSPPGIRRGAGGSDVVVVGKNLQSVTSVRSSDSRVQVFTGTPEAGKVSLIIRTAAGLPIGAYDLAVLGANGATIGKIPLEISAHTAREFSAETTNEAVELPLTLWAGLRMPGEVDIYRFAAKAGAMIVAGASSKADASKADLVLQLIDQQGRVLAASKDLGAENAPFLAHQIPADGEYAVRVKDLQMRGGDDHRYTLTIGELPWVVATHPHTVAANQTTEVELIGFNLPANLAERRAKVQAGAPGKVAVPLDRQRFYARGALEVGVTDLPNVLESAGAEAPQRLGIPVSLNGALRVPGEEDTFRFAAQRGRIYAIETEAARRGSPADTRIAVLFPNEKPVPRLLFEAARDSAVTFRAVDSATPDVRVENWREMELNELMWTGGEINKIFRMPEGPDSGFQYYANAGKRIAYFNTTPTAHALDEPCYIVEPRRLGTPLAANGLPRFVLNYENDDDGDRELGTDSRLLFTAPEDGEYLVRVSESRGFGGEHYVYRLAIREAVEDFGISVADFDGTVNAESGAAFSIVADRKDGFDGDITCEILGVPAGWHVTTPLVIQAGHLRARGSITALPGAKQPTAEEWKAVEITARATIHGQAVDRKAPRMPLPKLQGTPQLYVALVPPAEGKHAPITGWMPQDPAKPWELAIAPGEILPMWLVARRAGAKGALRFDVENLPHGVIVDNLGLNGITLLDDQEQGEIFIKAAPWVRDQECLAYTMCRDAGKQASLPFVLKVKAKAEKSKLVEVK